MGKFLKICLTLGIICIGVGIAASGAGVFNGGLAELKEQVLRGDWNFEPEELMGKVDLDINLDVDPFFELEEQQYFEEGHQVIEGTEDREEHFAVTGLQEIHIKSSGVTVELVEYVGDEIVVNISKVNQYQSFIKENELHIIARGQNPKSLGDGVVKVAVPSAVYESGAWDFDVESSAGVINLNRIKAQDVEINVSAGTVSWTEMQTGELSIQMSAGAVNGAGTIVSGETGIELKAGNVDISGILGAQTDIEMAAGKVSIALEDAYKDYNYDISCAGGSVKVGDQVAEGLAKSMEINNKATKEIDIECSMGAVNITFAN